MKNCRKNRLFAIILSIAIAAGSIIPAGTVHATEPYMISSMSESSEPAESQAPEETPGQEESTAPTKTPEESSMPESPEPIESQVPEESSMPESPEPIESQVPEESSMPESPEPIESQMPEESQAPEETPGQEESTAPTETPEESSMSESPEPTESQMPEESQAPELDYILGRPMTEEEKAQQEALVPDVLPDLPEEVPVEGYQSGMMTFAAMEEAYDSRQWGYLTSVKNQNPYGSCWTYAAMAAMESSLIMQGAADTTLDLSEWHLAYFATHSGSDELGNTKGDYVSAGNGITYMNNGGNAQMAVVALSNWKGAAAESNYPMVTDKQALVVAGNALTPKDAWLNNSYYLDNCYMTPASDKDSVKQLIQAFGAVYGSYYHHDNYYNPETAAYYIDISGSNHAIAVVGWDDNYKKENFTTTPEGDGAWICKNSWGSNWGDEGYFYISYYDASFGNCTIAAYEAKEIEEGLNNYYYSGGVDIASYLFTEGIAQCYTAKANAGNSETIVGTGFMTYSANVGYSVQVYKNPELVNGVIQNPLSGEAMWAEPETGVTSYAGYHSIDFTNPVVVEAGDVFAVVISFDKETAVMVDATYALSNGVSYVYDSYNSTKAGESFSKPAGLEDYVCLHDENNARSMTPRMNVFTRQGSPLQVYADKGGNEVLLGKYYSLLEAMKAISENADLETAYEIVLSDGSIVADELIIPEGIRSLTISGDVFADYIEQNADAVFMGTVTAKEYQLSENCSLWVGTQAQPADVRVETFRALSGSKVQVMGEFVSTQTAGFYGSQSAEADGAETAKVIVQADKMIFQDVTLYCAELKADKDFIVDGVVVSENEGNRLITRQKVDENETLCGVYLEINGDVVLSEESAQIEILVKLPERNGEADTEEDAYLYDAPYASALLVKTMADAGCFKVAPENCGGTAAWTVKKEDGIYVYYREDVPIEVIRTSGEKETVIGQFTSWMEAVKAVGTKKDKTAFYTFVLYDSLGEEQAVEMNLPSLAAGITIKAAEGLEKEVVIHLNNHLVLKSDTVLENVVLCPEVRQGAMNIQMDKFCLSLKNVTLSEGKKINKITQDIKKGASLYVAGKEEGETENRHQYEVGAIQVNELEVGENTILLATGKATVGELFLERGAVLSISKKESSISKISSYVSVSTGTESASKIAIKSNADLTINNEICGDGSGALLIEKEDVQVVADLADLKAASSILTAEKAASSDFVIGGLGEDVITFKHAKEIYVAPQEAVNNGLLQTVLSYPAGSHAAGGYSYFVDWYQAVCEINRLNQADADYILELLGDITVTRRLDGEYQKMNGPKAFTMPAVGKYTSLLVEGNHHHLIFTGDVTIRNQTILRNLSLAPVKQRSGTLVWSVCDLFLKADKKGNSSLTLENVTAGEAYLSEGQTGYLFRNIEGDGKNTVLFLQNNTMLKVKGNVTGLKALYLGMDMEEKNVGAASLFVTGKLTTKLLGIWNDTPNDWAGSSLYVTGQMTAGTLKGQYGILALRQSSEKNKNTLGKITGISKGNAACPLTVLVLNAKVNSAAAYEKKLAVGENPFVSEVIGIPILQAPAMSAECVRVAKVESGEDGLTLQMPQEVRYYKDNNQYIRAIDKEDMRIRITAQTKEGIFSVSYAANWYQAVQSLNKMANNYASYQLELLEDTEYVTSWNTQKKKEAFGKLFLPSKVKGTVEITCAEGIDASIAYSGEMKVPDKMTLLINGVAFSQKNTKKVPVSKEITLGKNSTLQLTNVSTSCQNVARISAEKGNLILDGTAVNASGKVSIKNLYVNEKENKIIGKSTISIQFIKTASTGKLAIETVSKYKKTRRGTYQLLQLSQLSVTGAVDAGAKVTLQVKKDAQKAASETDFYTTDELLIQKEEALSAKNRLAVVTGSASDAGMLLVNHEGIPISDDANYFLVTEKGGLYLVDEEPVVKVVSTGGTTDDYLGYFRSAEAALAAVDTSVKKDLALSTQNQKEYHIIFLKEPERAITCKLSSRVKKLVIGQEMSEADMPLSIKGNLSYTKKNGTIVFDKVSVTISGNVSATNLGLQEASLETKGIVTLQSLDMENSSLKGKNVTISGLTVMQGSELYAVADNAADTGKLKLYQLADESKSKDDRNLLAAKVSKKGTTQIQITGAVYKQKEQQTGGFAVLLYQNRNASKTASLVAGRKLLLAPKADSDFFVPAYADETEEMAAKEKGFGIYKKERYVCYGNITEAEAVLDTITEREAFDGSGLLLTGNSSVFLSLEEALEEISSRKNKKASYRITLLKDVEIRNSKGIYSGLTLPAYAKQILLSGGDNALSYLGKLTPECEITLENIRLLPYRKTGKAYKNTGVAIESGREPLYISQKTEVQGSMQAKNLVLADAAVLYARDGLTVRDVTYGAGSSILAEKEKPLNLSGELIPVAEGERLTLVIKQNIVASGSKVIVLKSFFGKIDLNKLILKDMGQQNSYALYQDKRAVYARRRTGSET